MLKRGSKIWVLVLDPGKMVEGYVIRKLTNGNYLCKLLGLEKYQEIESKYIFSPEEKTTGWLIDRLNDIESEYQSDPDGAYSPAEALKYMFDCCENSKLGFDWDETYYHGITHSWFEFD